MSQLVSAGALFRQAVKNGKPLQVLGTVNAYSALIAKNCGAKSLYLSGSGVATASYGLPDLGITNVDNVCEDIRRITSIIPDIPLLVDIDTGFGSALGIRRCIQQVIKSGAGGVHIEDQVAEKRCGHRPGKQIVPIEEMIDRLKTCHLSRNENDPNFVIMARTDAYSNEGMDGLLKRCEHYIKYGNSDILFPEALTKLEEYELLIKHIGNDIPILANITEFGQTPLFTTQELYNIGVNIVLYPLSAHRAMMNAAKLVYQSILDNGHQKDVLNIMQTRNDLYDNLNYHKYEQLLDELFKKEN